MQPRRLGKRIDWLDGLIMIGDQSANLQHPQRLAIKEAIISQLSDPRLRVDNEVTEFLYRKAERQEDL
jgi:hypothetical protein